MSNFEQMRHEDDFSRIAVFHRMNGPGIETFIDQTRLYADEILGKKVTSLVSLEDREQYANAGFPYAEVVKMTDLRLPLFERRDIPENRSQNRFETVRRNLRKGVLPSKKMKVDATPRSMDRDPLALELEMIALSKGLGMDSETEVIFDRMTHGYNGDIIGANYSLFLQPSIVDSYGSLLLEQAKHTQRRIGLEAHKLAYPATSAMLSVRFIDVRTMPEGTLHLQRRFMRCVEDLLPVSATLGTLVIN